MSTLIRTSLWLLLFQQPQSSTTIDAQLTLVVVGILGALGAVVVAFITARGNSMVQMEKRLQASRTREDEVRTELSKSEAEKTLLAAEKDVLNAQLNVAVTDRDSARKQLFDANERIVSVIKLEAKTRSQLINMQRSADRLITQLRERVKKLENRVVMLKQMITKRDIKIQQLINEGDTQNDDDAA